MDYDTAFGLLDREAQHRYNVDVFDFLAAYSDGLALELFPDCEDLLLIAEALEEDSFDVEDDEI